MMLAERDTLDLHGELGSKLFAWVEGRKKCPAKEILAEGPAGTGKTRVILEALLRYAEKYPRSKIVFLRNERAAMTETLLVEWEEVVFGPFYPHLVSGAQRGHRDKYGPLPNGSEFILRGFNDEQKLYSGQFHIIFFNEATELKSEEKWQTLHRSLRAPCSGGQPFLALIADCNPRQRSHWLNRRAHDIERAGREFDPSIDPKTQKPRDLMLRIRTDFTDNGRWYDHGATHLPEDERYTQDFYDRIWYGLRTNTGGVTNTRLFQGLWEDATGALMPEFDSDRHVIDAKLEKRLGTWLLHVKGWPQPVEMRWFFAGFDAGYTTAVLGIWGVDIQGRMFEVAEYYRSRWGACGERHGWTHDDWARRAVSVAKEFQLQGIVSDHDPSLIEAVNRALINAGHGACVREANKRMGMAGDKAKDARIEMVRAALQRNELFYVKGCNREVDEALVSMKRPWCTPMEIPDLRYREFEYGVDDISIEGKVDKSIPDHGFDMTCYSKVFQHSRQVQGTRTVDEGPFEKYWLGDWKGFAKAR